MLLKNNFYLLYSKVINYKKIKITFLAINFFMLFIMFYNKYKYN